MPARRSTLFGPQGKIAISWLQKGGFSARRAWSMLPDLGLPKWHYQSWLNEWRRYGDILKKEHFARRADPYEFFPHGSMVETKLKLDVKYRTYFDVKLKDVETGEVFKPGRKSMYTDYLKSPDEWESDFLDKYRDYWRTKGFEIDSIVLTAVEHQEGWEY